MDIQIKDDRESKAQKAYKKPRQRRVNPLNSIVIRTLICIVIIDLAIWGYFSIKGVGVAEGLAGWQKSFRNLVGLKNEPTVRNKKIVTKQVHRKKELKSTSEKNSNKQKHTYQKPVVSRPASTDDEIHDIEIKAPYLGDPDGTIYSWKDVEGYIHYSNTGFPEGKIEKLWVRKSGN